MTNIFNKQNALQALGIIGAAFAVASGFSIGAAALGLGSYATYKWGKGGGGGAGPAPTA